MPVPTTSAITSDFPRPAPPQLLPLQLRCDRFPPLPADPAVSQAIVTTGSFPSPVSWAPTQCQSAAPAPAPPGLQLSNFRTATPAVGNHEDGTIQTPTVPLTADRLVPPARKRTRYP